MIKAIIFDYYGVLTSDSYMNWLEKNPEVEQQHADQIEELSRAQDEGLDDKQFFARLAAISGQSAHEVQDGFQAHGVAHVGLLAYIRHLRRIGLKTAILSNSGLELYDEAARHHLTELFDVILCSEEAGFPKPDPRIYRLILKRLDVPAAETLFIDDRAYNVDGAEAVGIESIIYTGLRDLKNELRAKGIDSPVDAV